MNIRKAAIKDATNLFNLRNDPVVRKNSFNSNKVDWESHVEWLKKKLADKNSLFLIVENNGKFIGQVRLDKEWTMSISLTHEARGKGFSSDIIKEATKLAEGNVNAYIKKDNKISIKAFKKAGFKEVVNQ